MRPMRIDDNNIRITARKQGSFLRIQPKYLGGIRTGRFHEPIQGNPFSLDTFAKKQQHPLFNPRHAAWALTKIACILLFILQRKWTMVRRNDLNLPITQRSPKSVIILLLSQRRCHDIFYTL